MIYFDIPSGTYDGLTTGAVRVNLDRGLRYESEASMFSTSYNTPLSQSRPEGINNIKENVSFSVSVGSELLIRTIDRYFFSLRGTGTIDIIFPEGSKKIMINNWNVSMPNSLYHSITASGELVFL
jgi:hypothetical protein